MVEFVVSQRELRVSRILVVPQLPSLAEGGVAEGRGGVIKLSFITDLFSNPQPARGMKRRRFIYKAKQKTQMRTTHLKELGIRVIRFESLELVVNSIRIELEETRKATGIA